MKLRVILTGATGMVGEGVLLACLNHPEVEKILVINRKPGGRGEAKIKEIVHADFFDLADIESQLSGYNACFFCLGTSSVGLNPEAYQHVTYDLTLNVAQVLRRLNPDLTFCYVTGAGTDSSESGRVRWARVKGATENALLKLFPKAYMFRPAFMLAMPGQKNLKLIYKMLEWVYPIGRAIYPKGFCTLDEVGRAMIRVSRQGAFKRVLEVPDIVAAASLGPGPNATGD